MEEIKYMCKYETVILIKPSLDETEIEQVKIDVENKINEVGKVTKKEDVGLKKLAYEVKSNKEAYYVIYEYETNKAYEDSVKEVEKFYRMKEEILKFITIREDNE